MTQRPLTLVDAARSGSELPTAQRMAKTAGARVVEDQQGARKVILADDTPLGRMAADKRISNRQYQAGCEFRSIEYRAHGPDLRASNMEPAIRGGGDNMSDLVIAARQQLALIRLALGEELYASLLAVCAKEESPSGWARSRNLHPANGAYALGIALTMLADKMGLEKD